MASQASNLHPKVLIIGDGTVQNAIPKVMEVKIFVYGGELTRY